MNRTESQRSKSWFFNRSRVRAHKEWVDKWRRRHEKKVHQRKMFAEALEPRVLFSAAPVEAPDASTEAPDSENIAQEQVIPASAPDGVNQETIEEIAEFAEQRWIETGITDEQIDALEAIVYSVDDLEGAKLGVADGFEVVIDADGAGAGWFIDETPWDDVEFEDGFALDDLEYLEGYDLLSVILHEQGHVLGLVDQPGAEGDLMEGLLTEGERLLPVDGQAEGATAGSVEGAAYLTGVLSDPEVLIGMPIASETGQPFVGENDIPFELIFDNPGGATGYSPYIDLLVEGVGIDGDSQSGLYSPSVWEDLNGITGLVDPTATFGAGDSPRDDVFPGALVIPSDTTTFTLIRTDSNGAPEIGNLVSVNPITNRYESGHVFQPGTKLQNTDGNSLGMGAYQDTSGNTVGIPPRYSTDPTLFEQQLKFIFGDDNSGSGVPDVFDVGGTL
ncbi:MAG: LEPR-XLL domain-containing protein, partial [Verrucomicrobiota bacterium]